MKNTLKLIFQEGDPSSLHPHQNIIHIRCMTLNKLLFEGLTRIGKNQKAMLAGASSVDISEDKMSYTFSLRDCAYSDGTKITAYDYEMAWKNAISPNSLCLRCDLFYVIKNAKAIRQGQKNLDEFGVKALDEKTLQVQLEHPYHAFLELLASSIFSPLKDTNSKIEVFSGPFVVKKWNKAKNLTLAKNPMYWDHKNIKLKLINIAFISDSETNFTLFQRKKVDWIGAPINSLSLEKIDALKKANILQKKLSTLIFWLHINTDIKHFKSKHIRKALSQSVNRSLINEHIIKGKNPTSFLPFSMTTFRQKFDYDPKKAKESFITGLQELNISHEDFPEIELSSFIGPRMKQLAQYLKDSWQKNLKLKVRLIEKDWNSFISDFENYKYEIGGFNETPLSPDPLSFLELIVKKKGWENKEYQKILLNIKFTSDKNHKELLVNKALEILADEEPVIILSNREQTFAANPHLREYFFDYTNSVDFSRAYFE